MPPSLDYNNNYLKGILLSVLHCDILFVFAVHTSHHLDSNITLGVLTWEAVTFLGDTIPMMI